MTVAHTDTWTVVSANGTQTDFQISFAPIAADAVLVVTLMSTATGAETPQVEGVDYSRVTVSGVEYVRFVSAPAATQKVAMRPETPAKQTEEFYDNTAFPGERTETQLDRHARTVNEVQDRLDRTLRVPADEAGFATPGLSARAGKFPFNASGGFALSGYSADTIDTAVAALLANSAGAGLSGISVVASVAALKDAPYADAAMAYTSQHTAARAGGFMFWKYDASSTATADDVVTVKPTAVGGAGRWIAQFVPGTLSVRHAGAAGDGSTDDTAAVAALEAAARGQAVNLMGLTCKVDAMPDGARWYNGAFRIGTVAWTMPALPPDHPLDGGALVVADNGITHPWNAVTFEDTARGRYIQIYAEGWRHDGPVNSRVYMRLSGNGTDFDQRRQVIWDGLGWGIQGSSIVGGVLPSGRISVLLLATDQGTPTYRVWHIWSDDGGQTWSQYKIAETTSNPPIFPHGDLFAYTAADGGSDSGGAIAFGYVETGTAGLSCIYTTTNGGASGDEWTIQLLKAPTGGFTPTEPAVFRAGAGKWIAFCRPSTGTGNAFYSKTSTGPLSGWSDWADSNIPCAQNPPNAVQAWGRCWLFITTRLGTGITGRMADTLHVADFDPDDLFDNPARPSPVPMRQIYQAKSTFLGYLNVSRLRGGGFIATLLDGETMGLGVDPPTSARLVTLSSRNVQRPAAAPGLVRNRRTRLPITRNPMFNDWDRYTGSAWTGITSRQAIANGWSISSSGGIDVTRHNADPDLFRNLAIRPRYAMGLSSASASGVILWQRTYGRRAMHEISDSVMALTLLLEGQFQPYIQAGIVMNFGSGAATSPIGPFAAGYFANPWFGTSDQARDGLWTSEHVFNIPSVDSVSWGTNGDEYYEIYVLFNNSGAFAGKLHGVFADISDHPLEVLPYDTEMDRLRQDEYTHIKRYGPSCMIEHAATVGSTTSAVATIRHKREMIQVPTVAAAPGYTIAGGLTLPSGTVSGGSFDQIGRTSARLVLTGTSFPTGGQELRTTGSDFGVLIDVGH